MSTRFYVGQKDYIGQLNSMDDAINAAGSPTNPVFQTGTFKNVRSNPGTSGNAVDYSGRFTSVAGGNSLDVGTSNVPVVQTAWLQSRNEANYSIVQNLALNPSGGQVIVGSMNPAGSEPFQVVGNSRTTGSHYIGSTLSVGSSTTVGAIGLIKGDGTTVGASLLVQNIGGSVIGMGNKSAVVGGAYDATPMLWGASQIECSTGITSNGTIITKSMQECFRAVNDAGYISFYNSANTTRTGFIQGNVGSDLSIMAGVNRLDFGTGGLVRFRLDNSALYPVNDNAYSFGVAGYRLSQIYAATGTINTSDARKKTSIAKLSANEIKAARQLSKEIGTYQWLEMVQQKGDTARQHIGLTVQRAIEIMEQNGLLPFNYAFICNDQWSDQYEKKQINVDAKETKTRTLQRKKMTRLEEAVIDVKFIDGVPTLVNGIRIIEEQVFDEVRVKNLDGTDAMIDTETPGFAPDHPIVVKTPMTIKIPVMEDYVEEYDVDAAPIYEQVLVKPAGDLYGFRYDQLNLFIAAGLEARLSALEGK